MKNLKLVVILICSWQFTITNLQAQVPNLINYQAVARDLSGNPLVSTPITVVFEIRQSSPLGTIVYNETHPSSTTSTNQFGLFNLEIGGGNPITGTFSGINWSTGLYYLVVTVNGDVMPSTQLLSVPFALHANTAASGSQGPNGHNALVDSISEPAGPNCANGGYLIKMGADDNDDGTLQPLEEDITYYICNGIDGATTTYTAGTGINILAVGNIIENTGDLDSTNEIQTISISNDTIYLSNGGYVVLPNSSGDNWGTQTVNVDGVTITGNGVGFPLSGFDGNYNSLTNQPTIPTQTSDLTNNSGFITSPNDADADSTNEIELPATADTNQVLTWNGSAWIAQNSGTGADNWGSQAVVTSGTNISGNGTGVSPLVVTEVDGSISNEIQTLSFTSPNLTIGGANTVNLSGLSGPTYTAGTGINLAGNVITNTAPDQTVGLTGAGTTSISGTYPNFTITSTEVDGSISNELQTLSFTSPNLSISGGNSVALPTGSVTSVGLTAPTEFSITGSPVTGAGTIGLTWTSQTANYVLAAPNAVAGTPSFRAMVAGDIPNLPATKITSGTLPLARGGTSASLAAVNGGIVYSTAAAMAITPVGVAGQILQSNGAAAPTWVNNSTGTVTSVTGSGNIASSGGANPNITFTGVLPIANGGTNIATIGAAGAVIYSNGTQHASTATGAVGQVLTSSGVGVPVWANLNVNDADFDPTNEIQTLTANPSVGSTLLTISGGNNVTIITDDADALPNNELNTSFAVNGANLELTDAGGTLAVPLTSIVPTGKWTEGAGVLYPTTLTNNVAIGANNPINNNLYVYRPTTTFGAGYSTIYGYRNGSAVATNGGASWDVGSVDAAVKGYSYYGNNFTAGVAGYNFLDYPNSAGVFGSNQPGTMYGALAFHDNAGTYWAGYFAGANVYIQNNLGIGETAPTFPLDVKTSTALRSAYFETNTNSASNTFGLYSIAQGTGAGAKRGGSFEVYNGSGENVGVRGYAEGSTATNYGVYGWTGGTSGTTNYGVYGSATGGTTNWAGYFAGGDVYIQNNVGIGTTSPTVKLDVANSTLGNTVRATNTLTSGTEKVGIYVYTSGGGAGANVGVRGYASGGSGSNYGVQGNAFTTGTTNYGIYGTASGATTNWAGYFAGDVYVQTNLGIGVTIPLYPLHVAGNALLGANVHLGSATPPGTSAKVSVWGSGWANAMKVYGTSDAQVMIIESAGDVGIGLTINPAYDLHLENNSAAKPTSNVWTVASDSRLKKDVKPFVGGLSDILKINPVWFTYNGKAGMPDDTGVGVIAQELQIIAPYMINEWEYKPMGAEDEVKGEKYLGVDNGAMTYMLINAIKEQQQMIDQQQQLIDQLKKEVEEIKNK